MRKGITLLAVFAKLSEEVGSATESAGLSPLRPSIFDIDENKISCCIKESRNAEKAKFSINDVKIDK